ncbi:MAG: pyridine nucleotide-disulfide oxidoreductase/dicluster-binding protein [Bacillota bacterium]|jgi:glutamate synthase (NADPH/NADH) small chain
MNMDPMEIQQMDKLCVQSHAPACIATCPLHVDVRLMIEKVAAGDFNQGGKIFRKTVPFPGIISRICDHPCQIACKRREAGDSINISALERAVVEFSSPPTDKITIFPPKKQRIAVVGGGLSSLTVTLELGKKGYQVVLFEATDRLGGSLWDYPNEQLPHHIIQDETEIVKKVGAEVKCGIRVGQDVAFNEIYQSFDAVYLGCGKKGASELDFPLNYDSEQVIVDPVTFSTGRQGVFAGGSLRSKESPYSAISSISDGRRAAISIERYLKNLSLSGDREKEGIYETQLIVNLDGIKSLPAVPFRDKKTGYTKDEAVAEAKRCLQCQCLECMKACKYLEHFKQYPGKCIRAVVKNIIIQPGMGIRMATPFINSCNLCGLCGEVCPSGINMATVNHEARKIMNQKGYMPPAIHDFPIRDMLFSNSEKVAFVRHQPEMDTSRYLFFPGCQFSASKPEKVEKTYRYLSKKLTGGVGLMIQCCGAPADWAGRQELFQTVVTEIQEKWREMGKPEVVLACPTCYQVFSKNLPEIPIKYVTEIFESIGLPEEAVKENGRMVAVHDACSARSEPLIQDSIRNIMQELGYKIEELPYNRQQTKCCGYGGLMYSVNPEVTEKLIIDRINESTPDYLTYCTNCRDFFVKQGKRAYYLLDLILGDGKEESAIQPGPGFSQRQENRIHLKKKLLRELWGEKVADSNDYSKIKLTILPEVEEKMERNFILKEDIQQVINYAEKTGNKLYLEKNGCYLAHFRPSIITYWVEYGIEDNQYIIHNAYSHRIQIIEDVKQS